MIKYSFILIIGALLFSSFNIAENGKVFKVLGKEIGLENIELKPLSINNEKELAQVNKGKFYHLFNNGKAIQNTYVYLGKVNTCRAGGCQITKMTFEEGASEYFEYLILFENEQVRLVKVLNYAATHGHEICAKSWLKQFKGYNGDSYLNVGKNVDAISGATISVYAITTDVEAKTTILKEYLNDSLNLEVVNR